MIKIYNTLSGQVEELKVQDSPTVKIYTCGPTVYDHAHVGHWFNYIRMDILIRALKANGLKPKWVMNITDVGHLTSDADEGEDKLETGAKREGKSAWEIAKIYTDEFLEGMKLLNISTPDFLVKATDHIPEQIDFIKQLEAKGLTYKTSDGIYFDISKFPSYKDFAKLDLDEQQGSGRVNSNPEKKQPQDFALWKFSPTGKKRDMEWDSPWGVGFPGWHIECSAMARKYLGDTLDIHTGGIDHIPIHHTNEIAQSQSLTNKPLANYWLHSNHLLIDNQKISKSLGNSITLEDLRNKGINLEALRINVLESNYRSQAHFSWKSLESASNRLTDYRALAALKYQPRESGVAFKDIYPDIFGAINQDLNSPMALSNLSQLSNELLNTGLSDQSINQFNTFLTKIDQLIGLKLSEVKDIDDQSKSLIAKREEARKAGNWQGADRLRDQVLSKGIQLSDILSGARWQWTK